MSKKTIEIDGSLGEGGGQILRTSLALSLITGKSFHLKNIRAGRSRPGLAAQHLMSVKAAARIGDGRVRGARLGSSDLVFEPGEVKPGEYRFDIGTAGATALVLHTIYLPLALANGESRLTITGGTHVKASPSAHFLRRTWLAYMQSLGVAMDLTLERCGFYPRGGGVLQARIPACTQIRSFQGITTASVRKAHVISMVAGLPADVATRQLNHAVACLESVGLEVETTEEAWPSGPGCMLGISLLTEPAPTFFFGLGQKGKPAEKVADDAVDQVLAYLRTTPCPVDEHSADQLVLPLAVAVGPSEFRVASLSSHLLTNVEVISRFLDRTIECEGVAGEPGIVRIS